MRQVICLAVLTLCLISIPGCDSTQPQESGGQTMQVYIEATNAAVNSFDVWEQYYDLDQDGIPDERDPDGFLLNPPIQVACRMVTDPVFELDDYDPDDLPQGYSVPTDNTKAPWNYSLEISIIRAGTVVAQRLTTTEALSSTFNMTPYSETLLLGARQPGPDCPENAVCNLIGRLPATHRIVVDSSYDGDPDSASVTFNTVDPPLLSPGERWDLICPGGPVLGEPRMDGTLDNPGSPPFTMDLEKGDTILVKARKNFGPPAQIALSTQPTLVGSVYLNGLRIQNLTGTTVSDPDARAGISFSFTVN